MSFPTTGVLDDFTRSDASSLGTAWGANIMTSFPTCQVVSNTARPVSAFKSNYWLSSFAADQEAFATLTTLSGASYFRLWARMNNPGAGVNGYLVTVYSTGDFYLEKCIGGTVTTLQTLGTAGTVSAGDKIGIECSGYSIKVYRNTGSGWSQAGTTQTDSAVPGAGYIGVQWGNSATGTFDDFGGGAIYAASVGTATTSDPLDSVTSPAARGVNLATTGATVTGKVIQAGVTYSTVSASEYPSGSGVYYAEFTFPSPGVYQTVWSTGGLTVAEQVLYTLPSDETGEEPDPPELDSEPMVCDDLTLTADVIEGLYPSESTFPGETVFPAEGTPSLGTLTAATETDL